MRSQGTFHAMPMTSASASALADGGVPFAAFGSSNGGSQVPTRSSVFLIMIRSAQNASSMPTGIALSWRVRTASKGLSNSEWPFRSASQSLIPSKIIASDCKARIGVRQPPRFRADRQAANAPGMRCA